MVGDVVELAVVVDFLAGRAPVAWAIAGPGPRAFCRTPAGSLDLSAGRNGFGRVPPAPSPGATAPQDPWSNRPDPWEAVGLGRQPQTGQDGNAVGPGRQHQTWGSSDWGHSGWGNWGNEWRQREFSIERRMWADKNEVLDLESQPQGYRLWKSKAKTFLTYRHPETEAVLQWAERQLEPITPEKELNA